MTHRLFFQVVVDEVANIVNDAGAPFLATRSNNSRKVEKSQVVAVGALDFHSNDVFRNFLASALDYVLLSLRYHVWEGFSISRPALRLVKIPDGCHSRMCRMNSTSLRRLPISSLLSSCEVGSGIAL